MYLTSKLFLFFISIVLLGVVFVGLIGVSIALPEDIIGALIVVVCVMIFFSVVAYNYPSIKLSDGVLKRQSLFVTVQKRDLETVKDLIIRYSYFELLFQDGTTWPVYDTWYSGGFLVLNKSSRKKKLESILFLETKTLGGKE